MHGESDRRCISSCLTRTVVACVYSPRRRVGACLVLLIATVFTLIVWHSKNALLEREHQMELKLIGIQNHMAFLKTMYHSRQEEIIRLKARLNSGNEANKSQVNNPEMAVHLKHLVLTNGTRAQAGLSGSNVHLTSSVAYQLMPHLMEDPDSLRPAYHMKGSRVTCEYVLGIPTVKRDKESYLLLTLENLLKGIKEDYINKTLIIIFVGEVDLDYVYKTARDIETRFPKSVENGLIEVLSPHPSYYPSLDSLPPTLGDAPKRFRWRTKQNLDAIYLMSYARTKGTYFLMLEDDVLSSENYMQEIREFTLKVSMSNPDWFFIEYCPIGAIGKLFRSSDLLHFITYVQLFYNNLPIDWLLESYLNDKVCTNAKMSAARTGKIPTFFPHENPPVDTITTDIQVYKHYTLAAAYEGVNFFWGLKPVKGSTATFTFQEPTVIRRYFFRSGNAENISDKFLRTVIEVLPAHGGNFTEVGAFDEFGLAEGFIKDSGAISAVRLRVTEDLSTWVILSEIHLEEADNVDGGKKNLR